MPIDTELFEEYYSELIFTSIVFLFFIQIFSDFVESTYILLLMTLSMNQNVFVLLFMFSPIIFLFFRRSIPDKLLVVAGGIMIACRIVEPLFDTVVRMLFSGLGVGCFFILFPALLLFVRSDDKNQRVLTFGIGLSTALAASVLLRTLSFTIDLSTYGWGQAIGWVLAAIGFFMLVGFSKKIHTTSPLSGIEVSSPAPQRLRKRTLAGITFGLTSILFFVSFAFSSPVVISRWTESSYVAVVSGVAVMTALFALILLYRPQLISKLTPQVIFIWNLIFVTLFVLTVYVNQIYFPDFPSTYPIIVPTTSFLLHVPLYLMIAAFPIILIDFMILSHKMASLELVPTSRAAGVAFTLGGGLYMLILLFTLILTSVWGFFPVIGVLLRDMFWFIILIAGIVLLLTIYKTKDNIPFFETAGKLPRTETIVAGLLIIMFLGTLTGSIVFEAHPVAPSGGAVSVRILTYNIAQGMNDVDVKNYDGQLELIRGIDADIIGLQETSKIAGNSDVVRYFADKLNLYSYFGPKGVTGTTGVALLSKYPIENPRTIYHYAEDVDRKQTATIEAEITVGSKTFTVYVTHTYGRTATKMILQNDILEMSTGKSDVVFMGDFNFRPFTEPYNLTTAVLDDSWWVKWPTGVDVMGENNSRRIDHIFLSSGTVVSDCDYVTDPQSDHPAYWVDIQW
ncbi:MAG: endonuclease/exonuclease/phosphatase family protein [Candidatus Thorarchaeota archaeon]|jgi:endonuclease/exonuclease/phosphatase family metal-dependent hydrolase